MNEVSQPLGADKRASLRHTLQAACDAIPTYAAWPQKLAGVPITYDVDGPISYALEGHRLILGDPGEGKGTSVIAPMLLHDVRGSNGRRAGMVVIDPKDAELVRLTRPVREQFSSPVYTLDPFGLAGATDGCNPLYALDPGDVDFFVRCSGLARAIIGEADNDGNDGVRWQTRARGLLAGMIGHVASSPDEERTLMRVRAIVRSNATEFGTVCQAMTSNRNAPPFVQHTGNELDRLLNTAPKELSGYLSVITEHTDFVDDPRIARTLIRSTFDWSHVRDVGATAYITVPDAELAMAAPWLRLMCEVSLQALRRAHMSEERRRGACDVHLIIDEAKAFGAWRMIDDGLRALRSERISLHLAYQNIAQIKAAWREGYTRITAVKVIQFLGSNDTETCEWIAKLAGETTIVDRSRSWNASDGSSWSDSTSQTVSTSENNGWTRSDSKSLTKGTTRGSSTAFGHSRQRSHANAKSKSQSESRGISLASSNSRTSSTSANNGGGGISINSGASTSRTDSETRSRTDSITSGDSTTDSESAGVSHTATQSTGESEAEAQQSGNGTSGGKGTSNATGTGHVDGGSKQTGEGATESERRRLMTVQEVRALDPNMAVVFVERQAGMLVRKLHFHRNPALLLRVLNAKAA